MDTIDQIAALPGDWHGAGTVSNRTLRALAERCPGPYDFTAETGTGRSTLLLSQLSRNHVVFAQDDSGSGDSLQRVRASPLLRAETVDFVIGATQLTLPTYEFGNDLDLVMIDGPHGFPFPELEYYYFYPRLRPGGVLIIDDIQIPSIRAMFQILKADQMWQLDTVVDQTAFFTRTDAPTFDPVGDGWWLQGYNHPSALDNFVQKAKSHAPPRLKAVYKVLTGRT
ncbi:class I SAM-dependent methyltransferase [Mycobacterium sp. BMJ-28]